MRRCLLEPIPELEVASTFLDAAADALLLKNTELASEFIRKADIPDIMDYTIRLVGKMTEEIHRQTKRPKCLPKFERDPVRMPTPSEQKRIFSEDGWRCRFCGTKVISKKSRNILAELFPDETRWEAKDYQRHPALYAMAASLDHVVPHGRGGKNERFNFVTACFCCQFGRGEWMLEESELLDPRNYAPIVDGWDGLSRIEGIAT